MAAEVAAAAPARGRRKCQVVMDADKGNFVNTLPVILLLSVVGSNSHQDGDTPALLVIRRVSDMHGCLNVWV